MANKCPTCRSDNPETARFCGECGTPLPASKNSENIHAEATETLRMPVKELVRVPCSPAGSRSSKSWMDVEE